MNERFIAPVCFVDVEAVLFCLSVKCHQTLVVHSRLAALIARVRREVEHVPYMCAPHIGMAFETFQHELMVNALVFFRVVSPSRVGGM